MSTHYVRAASTYRVTMPRPTSRDTTISYRALGVLVRLLGNAEGYDMPAVELARGEGREGRDAIRAALGELERAGYLVRISVRAKDNSKWTGQTVMVYDTAGHTRAEYADFPAPEKPVAHEPVAGKPVRKSSLALTAQTSKSSSSSTRAHDEPAAALLGPEQEPRPERPQVRGQGERGQDVDTLMAYHHDRDRQTIAVMTAEFGVADCYRYAAELLAEGIDPVPGRVRQRLLRDRRRSHEAAERSKKIRNATVPPPAARTPEGEAKARQEMARTARLLGVVRDG